MMGLLLGIAAGVAAGVYWRDDLMRLRDRTKGEYAQSARQRAADTLDSLESTVSSGLERTRSSLRSWSQTIRSGERQSTTRPTSSEGNRAETM
jgi:hypothetical protein